MVGGLIKRLKKPFLVIPVPYPVVGSNRQVRDKLQQESSLFSYFEILSVSSRNDWIPVFTPAR